MVNLLSVFADTEKTYHCNPALQSAVKHTIEQQYIVSDTPISRSVLFAEPAKIFVSMNRSFQAAKAYQNQKVCVLNFASATHAGGGVRTGASAQEECLCRCSTLYFAISEHDTCQNFHHKHIALLRSGQMDSTYNDDCIFSPDIVVFKSDDGLYTPLPPEEQYKVDVITCAAPNLYRLYTTSSLSESQLRAIHQSRARRILEVAKAEREEVLILGAFGCGAFRNPPALVAEVWAEVLKDYLYDFKTIEFAIVSRPDKPSKNYLAFKERFDLTFGEESPIIEFGVK